MEGHLRELRLSAELQKLGRALVAFGSALSEKELKAALMKLGLEVLGGYVGVTIQKGERQSHFLFHPARGVHSSASIGFFA